MAKEIKLPEVSDNVEAGDVVKVLVKAGDKIEVDQPIIELETDKAMFEVPASEAGTVAEVMVKEGDNIKVGAVILTVEGGDSKEESGSKEEKPEEVKDEEKKEEPKEEIKEDKKPEENETEKDSKEETASEEKEESKSKETAEPKEEDIDENKKEYSAKREPKDVPLEESPKNEGNKSDGIPAPASPSVRRLARELGVDINDVQGSGTGGRISDEDVKAFVKGVMQGGGATVSSAGGSGFAHKPLPDFSKWGETETEKMSNVRRVTAEGLSYAWGTTPMVTQFDEADITELEAFRKKNAPAIKEKGGQLTVTAILLKVVEAALRAYPQFNASIDMQKREIVYKKYFNIGIAADTDRGLLVPVIKEVDKKSLTDLSIELSEISEKARDRKITPEEMDGGNFTISNLGGIGGTGFTPIVYSPQVAILGVSRASYKPVYKDGEFVPRFVLPLGLTYDHRIIDGADAARFLKWVCNSLENPWNLML
jgi:pyruvate dehydrogenase E2 component (dihydrolipoamide acetyltransferase)